MKQTPRSRIYDSKYHFEIFKNQKSNYKETPKAPKNKKNMQKEASNKKVL